MDQEIDTLRRLYVRFNERDIDGVLEAVAENVVWANAMEGSHEHGREAVRSYWRRQMAVVRTRVEPIGFERRADGVFVAEVRQDVFDLNGQPLLGQEHGLKDRTVRHVFRFCDGEIVRFDVEETD